MYVCVNSRLGSWRQVPQQFPALIVCEAMARHFLLSCQVYNGHGWRGPGRCLQCYPWRMDLRMMFDTVVLNGLDILNVWWHMVVWSDAMLQGHSSQVMFVDVCDASWLIATWCDFLLHCKVMIAPFGAGVALNPGEICGQARAWYWLVLAKSRYFRTKSLVR